MARNPRNRTTQQPSQQPPLELNFRFSNRPSRSSGVPSLLDYSGTPQHLAQGHPSTYTVNQQYGRPQPYTPAQFANSVGIQPEIEGYGTLTWLSARAGVMITPDGKMVSFQEKEFCQKSIADLRAVLRVGLMLNFRATLSVPTSKQYVATSVQPIVGPQADAIFKDAHEIDLDPSLAESTHQSPRYSKILEYDTYSIVLMPFAHSRRDTVQLGSIITELNQFGNQEVLEYVGSSVQKRKIFLEQRTHLLKFGHGTVTLQHPAIHNAVVQLASFLLRRGGVTSINDLYEFFCSHTEQWIGEYIGHVYSDFTAFLMTQPFAFTLFENFVSARRNFPDFDYLGFIQTYFPTMIRPEERHEDVHYYHQPSHHNEMGMYQQSMVMAHQSSYTPAESVARHSLSSYTPHGSSSTSSQRSGSIFGHSMEPRRQNVLTNTQMQPEPPLNYSDNFPRNSSTSEFTSSIFMDPVRREDQTLPNDPLKLPNNFPSIPEILAMGDKVMRGFSLPEVNPESSSSQKEYDELCAEFETYLQVVQAKESKGAESSSTRIGHPNCTCKCTCGFMNPGNNN
ncbi:hypothetical protein CAEBREN_23299 [Caenorhabditis brenneri]|uniref:Lin-66-like winged helix domain-containing protein n=1 Tax=Caenorhabditis brenneri TaxID=135651 RepID=G0MDD8_CAEBE|nr:hypothetical protein CAEBREN_23299 [Caenorhabditis brenneri]